jgi:hypothetical protein
MCTELLTEESYGKCHGELSVDNIELVLQKEGKLKRSVFFCVRIISGVELW